MHVPVGISFGNDVVLLFYFATVHGGRVSRINVQPV